MRCPNTTTPRQHLGRKRYRLARREMRCVLEEGHEGPCAWEPAPIEIATACPFPNVVQVPAPSATPRTPEQIAASDARYREHLRRKHGR